MAAAELVRATGGTMEHTEQQMMQMSSSSSSSSSSSAFTSSISATKFRKVAQGLSRTTDGRDCPTLEHYSYLQKYRTTKITHCISHRVHACI